MSNSLPPNGLQHARLPCPLLSPGVCSNSCPLGWWCHPTISSSVIPLSSYLQSFPASGSSPMSWLFASGRQVLESLCHDIMYVELFLTFVSPDSSRCLFMPAWQQKAAWGWTLHLWGAALLTFGHLHGSRDVCFIKLCYDASPSLFFFWHWSQTQPMGISLSWPLWPSGISPVALKHLHAFWDNQLPSSPCNFSSPYLESATAPRSSGLFVKMGNGI